MTKYRIVTLVDGALPHRISSTANSAEFPLFVDDGVPVQIKSEMQSECGNKLNSSNRPVQTKGAAWIVKQIPAAAQKCKIPFFKNRLLVVLRGKQTEDMICSSVSSIG